MMIPFNSAFQKLGSFLSFTAHICFNIKAIIYILLLSVRLHFLITTLTFCMCFQIEQLKQEVSKKESEMQALQTKLDTLTNQNSDCKQHIEVLKESLTAKEQRANTLQTEVSMDIYLHLHKQHYRVNPPNCYNHPKQ